MDILPYEIMLNIFHKIDPCAIMSLETVSKSINQLCNDEYFWKNRIEIEFPGTLNQTGIKWKRLYYLTVNAKDIPVYGHFGEKISTIKFHKNMMKLYNQETEKYLKDIIKNIVLKQNCINNELTLISTNKICKPVFIAHRIIKNNKDNIQIWISSFDLVEKFIVYHKIVQMAEILNSTIIETMSNKDGIYGLVSENCKIKLLNKSSLFRSKNRQLRSLNNMSKFELMLLSLELGIPSPEPNNNTPITEIIQYVIPKIKSDTSIEYNDYQFKYFYDWFISKNTKHEMIEDIMKFLGSIDRLIYTQF